MSDPASSGSLSLVGLGVALFGVAAGPYAAVVMAALAGGMYVVSRADTGGRRLAAGLLLVRIVITAVVLSGVALWALHEMFGWDSAHLVSLVAFAIATFYDKWPTWGERFIDAFISRKAGPPT